MLHEHVYENATLKENFIITDKKTITELPTETFSKNLSKQNDIKEFITIKEDVEKHKLNFESKI